jgi:hypothetical protein
VRTSGSTWQRYCLTVNSTNRFTEYLRGKSFDETGRPSRDGERSADPSDVLARLATTGENSIREAVAANPNAPSDALVALASDLRIAVVREVAANPASQVGIATGIS